MSKRARHEYRPRRAKLQNVIKELDRESGLPANEKPAYSKRQAAHIGRRSVDATVSQIVHLTPEFMQRSREQVLDVIEEMALAEIDTRDRGECYDNYESVDYN